MQTIYEDQSALCHWPVCHELKVSMTYTSQSGDFALFDGLWINVIDLNYFDTVSDDAGRGY